MCADSIVYRTSNHIAYVTLNRPAAGNTIDQMLAQELNEAVEGIQQDRSVYAVILTGSGNIFCGGSEPQGRIYGIADIVAKIEQPVIAAINGDALGQGLELALACDIRLASSQAHFGLTQVASGYMPSDGGTQRLSRIVGKSKALELILTADVIDAGEALEIGLIHRILEKQQLADEAEKMAQTMVTRAPLAMRYAKEAVAKGLDLTLEQGLRLEADLYYLLHTTGDRTEGINAFQQKRKPEFKGK